jgi:hypothetical protein
VLTLAASAQGANSCALAELAKLHRPARLAGLGKYQAAGKGKFDRTTVAQALLPVLIMLYLRAWRTAKGGCATRFFRSLLARVGVVAVPGVQARFVRVYGGYHLHGLRNPLRLDPSDLESATDTVLPIAPGRACLLCLPGSKKRGSAAYHKIQYK